MKKTMVALIIVCGMMLTACSSGGESIITTTAPTETTTAADTTEDNAPRTTENTEEETEPAPSLAEDGSETDTEYTTAASDNTVPKENYPEDLYGPGMDIISAEEISDISYYGEREEGWDYARCDGIVYLAEPTGISFNIAENSELYDSENHLFIGAPEKSNAEFKKYRTGDSVCGLTVKSAQTSFSVYTESSHPERYFSSGEVFFEGSLEMTGYLVILTDDEYAVGFEGDIIFFPDNESQILPILNYNNISEEDGVYSSYPSTCRTSGGFTYQSEYTFGSCGNISEYDSAMFAAVEHNTPTRVKVTVDEISMRSAVEWFADMDMRIEEMEILG